MTIHNPNSVKRGAQKSKASKQSVPQEQFVSEMIAKFKPIKSAVNRYCDERHEVCSVFWGNPV